MLLDQKSAPSPSNLDTDCDPPTVERVRKSSPQLAFLGLRVMVVFRHVVCCVYGIAGALWYGREKILSVKSQFTEVEQTWLDVKDTFATSYSAFICEFTKLCLVNQWKTRGFSALFVIFTRLSVSWNVSESDRVPCTGNDFLFLFLVGWRSRLWLIRIARRIVRIDHSCVTLIMKQWHDGCSAFPLNSDDKEPCDGTNSDVFGWLV